MKISSQALLLTVSALSVRSAAGVAVGDKVCMTGYVMDNYCIDRGTFLDKQDAVTLKEPDTHSIYCLVEAPPCPANGYQVLGDPCEEGGDHTIGFRLDDTNAVLAAIRAVGKKGSADVAQTCVSCTNEDADAPTHGYRATVRGTVSKLGSNSAANLDPDMDGLSTASMAPMLTDIEVLGDDVACGAEEVTVPPECLLPKVGDEVCMTGYVMDNYCIDRGSFLDNADAVTLKEPEEHSIYCLVEAPPCPANGYQVLGEPCEDGGLYTPGFRLDDTNTVLAAIRAVGMKGVAGSSPPTCVTCTNEDADAQTHGYRATIKGTISELGSKSAANIYPGKEDGYSMALMAPLLTNIEVLSENDLCDDPAKAPQCIAGIAPPPPPTQPPTMSPVKVGEAPATSNCPEDLPNYKMLSDVVDLCYAVVPSTSADANDGVLKARVVYDAEGCVIYDGEGWVAMALSLDDKMPGSEGIIGLPDEGTVMKYNVGQYVTPTKMADDKQTLVAGSIMQENGKTVLTFTKLLKEEGEIDIVEGMNKFLFAYGSGNALTYHAAKGPFELDLTVPPPPTKSPVMAEATITKSPVMEDSGAFATRGVSVLVGAVGAVAAAVWML